MPAPPFLTCFLFVFFSLLTPYGPSYAALLAPITKDHSTNQYTLTISLKTPPKPTTLLLDLGASFTWLDCAHNYTSSTYHPIPCSAPLCASLHSLSCSNCFAPARPGCANDSCSMFPENPVTRTAVSAQALVDSLSLAETDGRSPGRPVTLPEFVFSCSVTSLLQGLAKGVSGLAGLGRSNVSLPAQVKQGNADVWWLGFVNGGANPRASIVIGGNQIEDNLLQFDVGLKRLGFSSSILVHITSCADFNFTSNNIN